jgi:hypothetical protein
MSIEIKVTGNSVPEIADKLQALAAQFGATRVFPASGESEPQNAQPEVEKPKVVKKAAKKAEPVEQAEGNESAAPAAAIESQPTTPELASTPAPAPSASEPLDFDKDVAPVVIDTVARVGRERVSSTLAEFGAQRASEVTEDQWPELVAALREL